MFIVCNSTTIFRVNVAICETKQLLLLQSTLFSHSVCFSLLHASIIAQTNVNIYANLFGFVRELVHNCILQMFSDV